MIILITSSIRWVTVGLGRDDDGRDGDDHDDNGVDDCDDDYTYIMMQCLCVCLSQKIITSHFPAERRRREVSGLLDVAGRRPSDYDDDDI